MRGGSGAAAGAEPSGAGRTMMGPGHGGAPGAGVPGGNPADVATEATTGEGRVRALQREVQGVTSIMTQNVERILARGENLEQLHSKSQDLEATSEHFRTTSQKMARRYWWKNVKLLIILGLVGVIVLVLIILLATGTIPT